jgi:acetate---CoA ligase (ADP-forming)
MIGRLKAARLLDGAPGAKSADRRGFARLLVALGRLATDTRGLIAEIDLNPVIVGPQGITAVDALIVQKDRT